MRCAKGKVVGHEVRDWSSRTSQVTGESSDFTPNGVPQSEEHSMCSPTYSFSKYLRNILPDTKVSMMNNNITKVLTIIELTAQGMRAR